MLIFVFSRRLVKPIELLVTAMKNVKSGRVEQIPSIDSTYEIEYLVRSFNEMSRNVASAKRALEHKLDELHEANQEIRSAQGTLVHSAKMISLGQLVAGVAHELNNPIAYIYGNMHHLADYSIRIRDLIETYRQALQEVSSEVRDRIVAQEKALEIDFILKDMADIIRSVEEGATRTKEIVLGLRTFSRMDETDYKPSDLHEGLKSTLKLLTSELKDRISVSEEFGDIPLVECNLSQMNQAFMNLISNAAQAIPRKGNIAIRTRMVDDSVEIDIEDSGQGISPENLEKIFDPFFTTKRVGQGTGLGLSIAYNLVQKHGGTIEVRSAVGRGSCFTIRLPLHPANR